MDITLIEELISIGNPRTVRIVCGIRLSGAEAANQNKAHAQQNQQSFFQ